MKKNFDGLKRLNKKKTIYSLFEFPKAASNKDYDFSNNYEFRYLAKKKDDINRKERKLERLTGYIQLQDSDKDALMRSRPKDYDKNSYRTIVNYSNSSDWLKKAQKKIHKYIVKELGEVEYLHSTIKSKSYATNAFQHRGENYTLAIDLKNFFTYVSREKLQYTLKDFLQIDSDVAFLYSSMLTSPVDEPPHHGGKYNLGQGLPSSPILAYLCHASLFEYIYNNSLKEEITMTVYVDDVVFSSVKPIPQHFIDRLFGLFKRNGLEINKDKIRLYMNGSTKKITGTYVSPQKLSIPNRKHEELHNLYQTLKEKKEKIETMDDYLFLYNIYLKFSGNYQYLIQVECRGEDGKISVNPRYKKFEKLNNELNILFPRGLKKKKKKTPYSKENMYFEEYKQLEEKYKLSVSRLK
ncbi:reverse transcriptase domain-containing protein [Erysipelothrix aquatica]|uniref:reverse transcriptase domain-containing protein n=1 Tax=Erysipelothrix aquatica TaxID=2683714 RepID=UPI0013591579|nr:reverse transcriptase domain-containing protein [Erysipelothrix aquatica]